MIGQTLSHYRITSALGAGGMGQVYRATDTTLDRDVAIKVLPPEVAQDPERLGRFRREAHLLAALNHPNIAAIYGLEEVDGKPFLALELVEGEDLAERLTRGAIPCDEALAIAQQIAEALEEAHGKGIVHRDLKPANVKLTSDGRVKVLDFGLAKAWSGDTGSGGSSIELSQSPTLARTGTLAGVILGTAAYMSPEQASGKAVDKRADIWSFGVVLFEMLTGRPLFGGETASEIMASVIKEEPSWDTLPAGCPPPITRLLRRCLRKRPRERLQDMGDARLEIQDVLSGTAVETGASSGHIDAERRSRSRERWIWATALIVAAGLALLVGYRQITTVPAARPAAHFVLDAPVDVAYTDWDPLVVSPDGRQLAFVGRPPTGDTQLWLRPLDSPETRALPGTVGAGGGGMWSPDSTSIAFPAFAPGGGPPELRKLSLASGTVQRICALPEGFDSGTWSAEGTIVFAAGGQHARLYSVPDAGGEARPLTSHDASRGEVSHHWPQFLPDGRHILFQIASATEAHTGLYLISLQSPGERRRIRPENSRFRFAAPGHLLFVQDAVLMALRFDARKLVTIGEPVPIAQAVAGFEQVRGWGWFSASGTGRVAWLSGRRGDIRLEWVDREGKRLGTLGEQGRYGQIALSPDDRRAAAEIADSKGQYDLWVIDVARGVPSRLTTDPANERDPVWSPDSQELVFSSDASGSEKLLRQGLQGNAAAVPLPRGIGQTPGVRNVAKSWLREGNTLLYLTIGAERTLWAVSLDGQGSPESLAKGFQVDRPQVSLDGRWLAYISQESGRFEVYVEPFRQRGERVRVSASGGGQPKWRGDGKELFYLSLEGALMAVAIRDTPKGLEVGMPTTLVAAKDLRAVVEGPDYSDYGVSADGRRFLVKKPLDEGERQRVHVVLDWPSLLH